MRLLRAAFPNGFPSVLPTGYAILKHSRCTLFSYFTTSSFPLQAVLREICKDCAQKQTTAKKLQGITACIFTRPIIKYNHSRADAKLQNSLRPDRPQWDFFAVKRKKIPLPYMGLGGRRRNFKTASARTDPSGIFLQ